MSEPSDEKLRVTRKSPLEPVLKLCPKCMAPLKGGSKFGGWLVPQDYYCEKCGYKGVVYLERPLPRGEGA